MSRPTPFALWQQSCEEHRRGTDEQKQRYGELLREHGLTPGDIDVVIPTGVNRSSWDILLRLVGISSDRLHVCLPSFGHTIIADSFLYLAELRRLGQVPRGSRLLLFTYGFGSSWCGLLLEH